MDGYGSNAVGKLFEVLFCFVSDGGLVVEVAVFYIKSGLGA